MQFMFFTVILHTSTHPYCYCHIYHTLFHRNLIDCRGIRWIQPLKPKKLTDDVEMDSGDALVKVVEFPAARDDTSDVSFTQCILVIYIYIEIC